MEATAHEHNLRDLVYGLPMDWPTLLAGLDEWLLAGQEAKESRFLFGRYMTRREILEARDMWMIDG